MNFSEFQWECPDRYVRQTVTLLKTNTEHRFIVVLIGHTLQFRSGLVTWHKDLVTEDEAGDVVGGGFVSGGKDPHTGKRFLSLTGKSGDFKGVPVRVAALMGGQLVPLLTKAGLSVEEVRTDDVDPKLNPFWLTVR